MPLRCPCSRGCLADRGGACDPVLQLHSSLFPHNKIYLPFRPTWWLKVNWKTVHSKVLLLCDGDLKSSLRTYLFAFLLIITGQWSMWSTAKKSPILISDATVDVAPMYWPLFMRPVLSGYLEVLEMLGWSFSFTFSLIFILLKVLFANSFKQSIVLRRL